MFFLIVAAGCVLAAVITAWATIAGLRLEADRETARLGDFLEGVH